MTGATTTDAPCYLQNASPAVAVLLLPPCDRSARRPSFDDQGLRADPPIDPYRLLGRIRATFSVVRFTSAGTLAGGRLRSS